jgi:hypothetical protein
MPDLKVHIHFRLRPCKRGCFSYSRRAVKSTILSRVLVIIDGVRIGNWIY